MCARPAGPFEDEFTRNPKKQPAPKRPKEDSLFFDETKKLKVSTDVAISDWVEEKLKEFSELLPLVPIDSIEVDKKWLTEITDGWMKKTNSTAGCYYSVVQNCFDNVPNPYSTALYIMENINNKRRKLLISFLNIFGEWLRVEPSRFECCLDQRIRLRAFMCVTKASEMCIAKRIEQCFQLKDSKNLDDYVHIIRQLLDGFDFLKAHKCIVALLLQNRFSLKEVCMPLFLQGYVGQEIDDYLSSHKDQRIQFIKMLNNMTEPSFNFSTLYREYHAVPNIRQNLLVPQKIQKVVKRLTKMNEISDDDKTRIHETEFVHTDDLMEFTKKNAPSYILDEDAHILSPTATAAASQLLKFGMPLTQQLPYRSPVSSILTIPPTPALPAEVATPMTVFGEADQKVLQETRMLDEQLEKVTRVASELRLQSAKLGSQLSYSNECYKILQSNIELHMKEIEGLRDKNQKLSESVVEHQQTVPLLREEAKTAQEKLSAVEVLYQNLLKEKVVLKSIEARLSAGIEALRQDFQSLDLLNTNLQSLQRESRLRKKTDDTDEQQKAFIITLKRQLCEARTDVDVEKTRVKSLLEQMETADSRVINLLEELSTTKSKLDSTETKLSTVNSLVQDLQNQNGPTQNSNDTQRLQLGDSERESANLQEKLDQSRKDTEQFKSVADGLECSLREQDESSEQFRESLESQLHEVLDENEVLNSENQRLSEEKVQLTTDSSQSNEDHINDTISTVSAMEKLTDGGQYDYRY